MRIAIVDYGAGNTRKLRNAVMASGCRDCVISGDPLILSSSDAIIIPGVGSFGAAMEQLRPIRDDLVQLISSKPVLGICLGMQVMFERSEESPGISGLEVLRGSVKKLAAKRIPNIGWSRIRVIGDSSLLNSIDNSFFYFAHSYYCEPADRKVISAEIDYEGVPVPCSLCCKNICATQFHPELSGKDGLRVLGNFINEVKK